MSEQRIVGLRERERVILYNEIEPYAAEWMRRLAKEKHIAFGSVDERSILDLRPADVRRATQFHAFAGLGAWSYALRLAGWPDDRPVWTGSCPCQPFSGAGRKGGFDDERHLWPTWFGLIRECRPPVIFGEQVASPDGLAWLDAVSADLERAGYAFGAADLCAAGIGAPHIRQRLYFVAIAGGKGRKQVGPISSRSRKRGAAARLEQRPLHGRDERMANNDKAGRSFEREARLHDQGQLGDDASGRSTLSELGDARRERGGRYARAVPGTQGEGQGERIATRDLVDEPESSGAARVVGDSSGKGPQERPQPDDGRRALRIEGQATSAPGPWSDVEWVPCRDGKYRPVEPGTFPLAHGATARVGRLRAYGNAIVPEVAATFIRAVMDVRGALTAQP